MQRSTKVTQTRRVRRKKHVRKKVAEAIANAYRAVGTAVGQNPISYLIPCHRVLRASGEIGGYHWGTSRKKAILALEAARQESI